MVKRLFDVVAAAVALATFAPLLALAALGVRLSSPGPVLYRARRAGLGGRPFTMYKLRTMHVARDAGGSPVTAANDPRVFPFGRLLRRTKIDEVPQLFNVLRGDMAIVGPRPEELAIVERLYTPVHHLTLRVRPGLASPGSLYQYTHGDAWLADGDPETRYATRLLPVKLALELIYLRRASFGYDLAIIARTLWVIAAIVGGRRIFPPPRELQEAAGLLHPRVRPFVPRRVDVARAS